MPDDILPFDKTQNPALSRGSVSDRAIEVGRVKRHYR